MYIDVNFKRGRCSVEVKDRCSVEVFIDIDFQKDRRSVEVYIDVDV